MYFEPSSSGNQSVRQALNYFLPVYCYSRQENQELMCSVALDAFHTLFNVREGLEDDDADVEDEMVSLSAIGACLVDWTDPRKCYSPGISMDAEKKYVNGDVHLDLARDILERLNSNYTSTFSPAVPIRRQDNLTFLLEEEKKMMAPLLGKLYISPTSTDQPTSHNPPSTRDSIPHHLGISSSTHPIPPHHAPRHGQTGNRIRTRATTTPRHSCTSPTS